MADPEGTVKLSVGTSGYAYKEWKGPFYPEDLPAKGMLAYYGERLPAVEINNTFYRLPKASVLAGWRDQVPEDFRFSIKASRRITHFGRLKESADEPTAYLLEACASLGDALGVLLFQLPPNLSKDRERLERFLARLPEGTRAAFEFRHPSWLEDDVLELLRGRGLALVASDTDEAPAEIVATAPFGYLRLRRAGYTRADLAGWAAKIRAQNWDEAFVFFKHEDEGAGPRLAASFLEVAERGDERKAAHPSRDATRERDTG